MQISISPPPPTAPAVRVSNGCKYYGNSLVLQGLDMTVQSGVTYALLGSSGCGKTTLLSAIVGLKRLSSGCVEIFGQPVSKTETASVGYMPQESGLHSDLTISEELHFFGRLYGMERSCVEERIRFFVNLLQLPGKNCIIQSLSGGETRRVSLAVTLLHKPKLIILDEATVGVDPLLRQSIWEHLYKLVREEGATIICSTHYTEEARQADVVSVMRNGRLLVEDDPQTLLTKYGHSLLEDVVLELCHSQELEGSPTKNDMNSWDTRDWDGSILNISYKRMNSKDNILDVWNNSFYRLGEFEVKPKFQNHAIRHLQTIYAMIILQALKLLRSPILALIILCLPPSICFIAYGVYRPEPRLTIGVVNLEQPNCFNLPPERHKLGCELVSYLIRADKLQLEPFSSEESAMSAVHLGQNLGYFLISENFSVNTAQRLAFGRYADKETLVGSTIMTHLDLSHNIKNVFLLGGLSDGYKDFTEKKLAAAATNGYDEGIGLNLLSPFKFNEKLANLILVEAEWYDKASMVAIPNYLMMMPSLVALGIVFDRKRGVFQRTKLAGGGLPHLMMSIIFVYIFVYVGQIGLIVGALNILGIPFQGSILQMSILMYPSHFFGAIVGIFAGLLFYSELEATFFLLAFFMIPFMAGAGFNGLESLNYWQKVYVTALPTKLASVALENLMFRGWTAFHSAMWSCYMVQGAWTASGLALIVLVYYRVQ